LLSLFWLVVIIVQKLGKAENSRREFALSLQFECALFIGPQFPVFFSFNCWLGSCRGSSCFRRLRLSIAWRFIFGCCRPEGVNERALWMFLYWLN
jgi:hypothetical protein